MQAVDGMRSLVALGPRPAGSPALERARHLIIHHLEGMGLAVQSHPFLHQVWEITSDPSLFVEGLGEVACRAMLSSAGGNFAGRLEPHGTTTVWGMYGWPTYRVRGDDDTLQAYLLVRPDGPAISQPVPQGGASVPHLVVGEGLQEVLDLSAVRRARTEGVLTVKCEERTEYNVRAWREGDSPGVSPETIMVTAHYDTVPETCGAYDNAGGVVALLGVAHLLAAGQLHAPVQLLFTSAEEFHLAGARAFVAELAAQDTLKHVIACLNLDGAGRGDVLEVWLGPERLAEALSPTTPENTRFAFPPPPSGDHYAFWERGIPAVMLTFNDLPILHLPEDDFDLRKVRNAERLTELAAAIVPRLHAMASNEAL